VKRSGATAHEPQPCGIDLVDVTTGKPFSAASGGSVLLSSAPFGWRGIVVEWQRLHPQELPEHYIVGHGLTVSTGACPIPFGWKDGDKRRDGTMSPNEFHLLTHGEPNAPRWQQPFEEISLVLDRDFVAHVVSEALPADRVEFATQRSARDETIVRYTDVFRSELAAGCPNGLLYADTLTIGLALHLLSRYAIAKPKIPTPRGKLSSFQLRVVVELIRETIDEDVSLPVLAEHAHVSPFHFARLFRTTVGMPPHQFVLRQRVQKSLALLKAGNLPLAQVAIASGFHDQPHFTRAFRKVVGMTPAVYCTQH
jgi:AraC family transcriptional regulator